MNLRLHKVLFSDTTKVITTTPESTVHRKDRHQQQCNDPRDQSTLAKGPEAAIAQYITTTTFWKILAHAVRHEQLQTKLGVSKSSNYMKSKHRRLLILPFNDRFVNNTVYQFRKRMVHYFRLNFLNYAWIPSLPMVG